jgi:exopolysaccharide biosynthesis polyprenyl glycosylphosphotransferase
VEALRRLRSLVTVVEAIAAILGCAISYGLGSVVAAGAAACWLCAELAIAYMSYHPDDLCQPVRMLKRHALYILLLCAAGIAVDDRSAAVDVVALLAPLALVATAVTWSAGRPTVRGFLGLVRLPRVLVVADRWTAEEAVADLVRSGSSSVLGVCLVGGSERVAAVGGVPVLGGIEDVRGLVASLNVHQVAVRLESPLDGEWLQELQWSLEESGARLTLVTGLRNIGTKRIRLSRVGNSIVLGVSQARPTGLVRRVKAVVEAGLAVVALVVALPLLMACAVAVKLDSPGPAFFRQRRVRDGGRTFWMLKLRTMSVDAEARRAELDSMNEVGGALFKMRTDPRVTRVGRVLRKFSLDELPQLVNVVRGEMSLVGPRPALPSEVATYDRRARRRLDVKPGLTGLWQVSGRSRLSWDESISLDIDYVDNWSAGRDVRIALSTLRAVASKDGAY